MKKIDKFKKIIKESNNLHKYYKNKIKIEMK